MNEVNELVTEKQFGAIMTLLQMWQKDEPKLMVPHLHFALAMQLIKSCEERIATLETENQKLRTSHVPSAS